MLSARTWTSEKKDFRFCIRKPRVVLLSKISSRWRPQPINVKHKLQCAVRHTYAVLSLSLSDPTDCSPPGSSVHGDSPGKNAGVGCHFLLQVRHTYILRIKITSFYIYILVTHSGDCGVHALCETRKYIAPKHILPLGTRVTAHYEGSH